jgi:uncharacterized protein YciI
MPLYIVVALDDEEHSVARRDALRPRHLDYVLADDRAIQFVGPMRREDDNTICGSVYVFEAPSAAHVQRWLDDEPYHRGGLYREVLIRRFEVRKNHLPHRSLPATDAHPASGESSSTTRRTSGKSRNAE